MPHEHSDVLIIGGGVIGASLAYGLSKRKVRTLLLDREDLRLTASRGNFGLVWVQGKGYGMPRYAEWSVEATQRWPAFSEELEAETGIRMHYHRTGGFEVCLGEEELERRAVMLKQMEEQSFTGTYDCEMLTRDEMQQMLPDLTLGPKVSGGSFCPHDGFANPLHLLKALHQGFHQHGGAFHPGHTVQEITREGEAFEVRTETHTFRARKLILASGLATTRLAEWVGMTVPVRPERGQVLVTERTRHVFPYATGRIRQNADGSFMLGASHEDVGYDLSTTREIMQEIATHAIEVFPLVKDLQLIRSWGALRVLTPDQKPVYVASESCPGAYAVTSHSGVSLASLHSSYLVDWVLEGEEPRGFDVFHPRRFDVPKAA
jgi:glycine/D-amino acid oxidase-like deaminating enzyme